MSTESKPAVETPAVEPPARKVKKALQAYIKYPNAVNYRAVTAAMLEIQQAYIKEFDIGQK